MRRNDREITDLNEIFQVIDRCKVLHLGMIDNDMIPYLVALNFGYERHNDVLVMYFHCAQEGRKIDLIKRNPHVSFQMECGYELVCEHPAIPCTYTARFESVVGDGRVDFITDEKEKAHALNCIIEHLFPSSQTFEFPAKILKQTCICRITSHDFTAKRHL